MKNALVVLLLLALVAALAPSGGCARSKRSASGVLDSATTARDSRKALSKSDPVRQAIDRGVKYLVTTQNPDGSWGTGLETRGFEVYSMVPGSHDAFRVATTALCVMALREAGETKAHNKGVEYLLDSGEARRDAGPLLYNVWAHTYALQALAGEMRAERPPGKPKYRARLKEAAEWHLDRLGRYEVYSGGWNYYDFDYQTQRPSMGATSFGTAAGLVALWEAREAGIDVPQKLVDQALRRLHEMRVPGGSYLYSVDLKYHPRFAANRMRGSLGRAQSCNYALWQWGSDRVREDESRSGLDEFFREHAFIEMGRQRQWPHEAWYATAPYYYYFGHYYTGRLLEKLGDEGRQAYGQKLVEVIVPHQETDGSWWDYAMWDYHKPYGTAYAVMTLLRCK